MMDRVFRGVEEIDKKAKCPRCKDGKNERF